ncbi:polysaccharide pyruvyl transferase family protein [Turicibacter sanguinis]|uniref:polysaccharide pyruvyl transferase family protein n=1 Tax=Turicibacter sanguinis TaxID=154288 RepID=UPI0021D51A31|nr:polysaccharide pyruvyl transferase family protein [Turicibacter sanguinis]MCU7197748.1 polysaccharide pyruvyl transferase family protein [Turicibacter sanguinis]
MKKITITNAYTWYNKGDAGILLGTVNAIKEIYGENIEINILSFTPEEDKTRYCKDSKIINVYSNILNPYPFKKSFFGKKIAILKLFYNMCLEYIKLILLGEKYFDTKQSLRVLKDSDLIVVCGGGFLGGNKFNSFMHLFQMYVNVKTKNSVVLWGTSIEPYKNNIVEYFTNKQIKSLTHVFPRESITNSLLSKQLDEQKFTLIPDMAFMLENKYQKFDFITQLRQKYSNIFGLTVREWHFPNIEDVQLAKSNYINSVTEMIEYYARTMNAVFVFIPQVIFEGDDDSIIAEEIKNKLKDDYKKNFIINKTDWSPVEIKSLIKNLDLFIGTRMHSNIFATSMAVPTVAIAYEKKTNGIMETVGLSRYVVEIDTITTNELIDKIDSCYKNRESISQSLEKRIVEIKSNIIDKSKFIKEL